MKARTEHFTEKNPNPVLSVEKDGTVLYSNEAAKPLLIEWDVETGEKLPSYIGDIIQRVLCHNSPEKIEVKAGEKTYLVAFHPLPEEKCINIFGFDISDWREFGKKVQGSAAREVAAIELADIFDIPAIQSLMDDLYKLTHITIALVDLKGNIPVIAGRQEICTRFHRVHPETCKHCVESDTKLSLGVAPGEFKMYKCKNNMWDVATPLIVGGQHIGNIFSGHFFFEDEPLEYELFRSQARKYGFNEEEYIAALEKVPRLSREAVNKNMSFFMKLANMLSQLSHSNFKLAQSLAERDTLVDALQKNWVDLDRAQAVGNLGSWRLDVCKNELTWSDEAHRIFGIPKGAPLTYETFLLKVHPDDREYVDKKWKAGLEGKPYDIEHRIVVDGKIKWVREKAYIEFDNNGVLIGGFGITQDITESKKAEEAIRLSNLYNRSLIEASLDPLVTIGRDGKITDVNGATEQVTGYSRRELIGTDFSDYFTEPEKARIGYQQVFTEGLVRDYPLEIEHKDGHITPVLYNASVYRDENGEVIGAFAAARDITERKKAVAKLEETLDNLENLVNERTADLQKAYNSLKESEGRLAEAQRIAHLGNWDLDLVTGEVGWSDEMYRIYGLSPNESRATYENLLNYIHPDDREYFESAVKRGPKGEFHGIDYRITLANGEERTVHVQPEVLFDKNNTPIRVKGITQDITERKKAEEKIRYLANVVESSNDAIGTLSPEGTITSWNKGAEQVYGYSVEEILGKCVSTLAPPHLAQEMIKLIEKVKQGEKIHNYETLRLRKDGKTINVSITLSPVFEASGVLTVYSFISRDITESKRVEEKLLESEEKYRNIVETANEGISLIDAEERVTFVNKKIEDMFGYSSEELIGRSMWDFLSDESKAIIKQILENEWQNVNRSIEIKFIRKDGSPVWAYTNSKSLFDKNGKFMGTLNLHTDITERKKAEEALRNFETARKKEIHHRIKNNLQVISSLLDLQAELFKGRQNIRDSEVLKAFKESMDRVLSIALIHEELYKGENTDTLNFSKYIEELVNNLLLTYRLKTSINLNFDLKDNLFLDMDTAIPLGIVINEIVSNSFKYAFSGRDKGEIRVKFHKEEKGDCKIEDCTSTDYVLSVSDNGVGIPEDLNIEDLDSLGLQLVTSLVDQLDGELELKRDNGTEFTIKFNV